MITARIAYLLSEGVPANKILAVTFTNKAANEMRNRVGTLPEKVKGSKLTICTFHALCVRILRQDIEKLGYKTNFSIYDESDQLGLIRKIVTRLAAASEKLDPQLAKNLYQQSKKPAPENPPFRTDFGISRVPALSGRVEDIQRSGL